MAFKSILDPTFEYRNAASTDVRKTFERVRRKVDETAVRAQDNRRNVSTMADRNNVQREQR
jgi:hypothetical protein